jgi:predicted Zn-dependent protease
VNVYSGDYGATGWVGLTQMVFNSAQTYFTKASVSLNDHYGGNTEALHWNPACHELGHVLGLGHNVSTASCMYYRQSGNKYPTSEDRGLLERYY